MDPISQGTVGAVFAQVRTNPEHIRAYAVFGALAGMAPDLDVFIRSSTDPLLFLEFHRHFTHALVFIPIGALIVCSVLYRLWRHPLAWHQAYSACLIGYATHGLLDSCTSYGTQLFWPFSDVRVAWNNVSVVDPLATIPLILLAVISALRRSRVFAIAGVTWIIAYLLVGVVQHDRAMASAAQMAAQRGHVPHRLTVKPGFGNLILWKSIYQHEGLYFVDAVRVLGDERQCQGESIEVFDYDTHLPGLARNSQQARDIERFRWFSGNYIAAIGSGSIVDVRYSAVPNEINPLWGIQIDLNANAETHARFIPSRRTTSEQSAALLSLLTGKNCNPIPRAQSRAPETAAIATTPPIGNS